MRKKTTKRNVGDGCGGANDIAVIYSLRAGFGFLQPGQVMRTPPCDPRRYLRVRIVK